MAKVIVRYFTADREFTKELVNEWNVTQVAVNELKSRLLEKYKAQGFLMQGNHAKAICIAINADEPLKEMTGMSVGKDRDGDTYYAVYSPNKRFKEGKELASDLVEFSTMLRNSPAFSDFVVKKLNCHRLLAGDHTGSRSGVALYGSTAGVSKGQLALAIPSMESEDESFQHLPATLREIKKSDFVALTEE